MKLRWFSVLMLAAMGASAEEMPIAMNGAADGVWRVEHTEAVRKTFPVAELDTPMIGEDQYGVVGEVRYQGVQGKGMLEMWNHFGERSFFSRTVEDKGPMRSLTGDSDWRTFALPFFKGEDADPEKLVINVVLEGQGTVELRNLRLIPGGAWRKAMVPGAWWAPRTSGILGAVLGVTAGLLGTVMGFSVKSPKGHGLAGVCAMFLLVSGLVSLTMAVVALAIRQPGYVSYLFLLFGVVGSAVGGNALRQVNRQRTQAELRRMDAADAASGIERTA